MDEKGLTIKEAAALSGLSGHTLRYYEREGLVHPIDRARSGHRRYSERDVAWIEFLRRLRATGMPIREMKRFADLRRVGAETVSARRALLDRHRIEVRRRIAELEKDLIAIDEKVVIYEKMEVEDDAAV
jgi:DNA-binding transcriptional MerR regulator